VRVERRRDEEWLLHRLEWRSSGRRTDNGFSLAEVIIALGIIAVALAGAIPFVVSSVARLDFDRQRQAAVRLAADAAEQARAVDGATILAGRGNSSSAAQWAAAPAEVRPYLDRMQRAWDPDPSLPGNSGAAAVVPTSPRPVTLNGITYEQNWYVGRCRQQGATGAAERPCENPTLPDSAPGRVDVPVIVIAVAVTWPHRQCPGGTCAYATSSYVSAADDPIFSVGT
jgi:prepilin-type N-terminal cleavage/methylation domain-containing protein